MFLYFNDYNDCELLNSMKIHNNILRYVSCINTYILGSHHTHWNTRIKLLKTNSHFLQAQENTITFGF